MSDDLVRRIVNESHGVSVKVGRTNGRPAYHIIHSGLRQSQTIYTQGQWDTHPWNDYNRPKASKEGVQLHGRAAGRAAVHVRGLRFTTCA